MRGRSGRMSLSPPHALLTYDPSTALKLVNVATRVPGLQSPNGHCTLVRKYMWLARIPRVGPDWQRDGDGRRARAHVARQVGARGGGHA